MFDAAGVVEGDGLGLLLVARSVAGVLKRSSVRSKTGIGDHSQHLRRGLSARQFAALNRQRRS